MNAAVRELSNFLLGYDSACGVGSSWGAMVVASQLGSAPGDNAERIPPIHRLGAHGRARAAFLRLSIDDRNTLSLLFHECPSKVPPALREDRWKLTWGEVKGDTVLLMAHTAGLYPIELCGLRKGKLEALHMSCVNIASGAMGRFIEQWERSGA